MKKPGPTGKFPRGRKALDDEGEIKIAITADKLTDTIRLDFNKGISWFGLGPEEAAQLAVLLLQKVKELKE